MNDIANDIHFEDSAAIKDPVGLHARPAVKLTQMARKYAARIEIRPDRSAAWVNVKSISALMKLKARHGEKLHLRAVGEDAERAVNSLTDFIAAGFE